ncbi:MAG TPA: hypothetical protein VKV28_09240 [Candidatus Binataceae bacterium]|nr:hypothetical protein [Candidatus Binataceae bacterium]
MLAGIARERGRRVGILAMAVLLLAAQSLSAAHFHQQTFQEYFGPSAQVSDVFCALCLFHFHSPTQLSQSCGPTLPVEGARQRMAGARVPLVLITWAKVFSRAPPVAL